MKFLSRNLEIFQMRQSNVPLDEIAKRFQLRENSIQSICTRIARQERFAKAYSDLKDFSPRPVLSDSLMRGITLANLRAIARDLLI